MTIQQQLETLTGKQVKAFEEWQYVYFVKFASGRPTFVSKKKVVMSHYEILVNQFGDEKAALWVMKAASEYFDWSEVEKRFHPRHHETIRKVWDFIRAEQEAAEKEFDSWVDEGFEKEQELRHLQPKFRGSEKQQRWASYIWDRAANQLAHSDLSFEEAKAILLASNMASYWIDRRSEWGC